MSAVAIELREQLLARERDLDSRKAPLVHGRKGWWLLSVPL
jgi:hypothetical protein